MTHPLVLIEVKFGTMQTEGTQQVLGDVFTISNWHLLTWRPLEGVLATAAVAGTWTQVFRAEHAYICYGAHIYQC